jgi:hypothetical protein
VRAIDTDGRESIRNPDSDTSTIQATSGQIATSQLNDDASFAGAELGDNLRDEDGTTILGKEDVKNNEITDLFLEDGTILNTEGGNPIVLNTVGDSSVTVRNSLDGVEANYSVKVDLNGRVSGFGLIATEATATPFSAFAVIADQFAVVDPDSTADQPIVPFAVTDNKAVFTTDVEINGDLLTTGTVSADRISIDGVMFDTAAGALIIADAGVDTDQVSGGAISETFTASAGTFSTSGTTLVDTGLSLSVTISPGATITILINYDFQVTGSASTDKANTQLIENTPAGDVLIRGATHAAGNTDHSGTGVFSVTRSNTTANASVRTYRMQAKTASASTTVQISEQAISITELKK